MTREEFEALYGAEVEGAYYEYAMAFRKLMPVIKESAFITYLKSLDYHVVELIANGVEVYDRRIKVLETKISELNSALSYETSKSRGIDKDEIGNLLYEAMKGDADRDELRTKCIALIGEEDYAKLVIDDSDIDSEDADLIKDLL